MRRVLCLIFAVTLVAGCSDGDGPGPEPCANVTCDDPPDAECADANTVRIYTSPGTCSEGNCDYPHQDINCPNGCENGLCKDCVPEWVDVTACDCTPGECAGCDGTLQHPGRGLPPGSHWLRHSVLRGDLLSGGAGLLQRRLLHRGL